MKTLKIYARTILVRTGFKKYPYKEETQVIVYLGNKKLFTNCNENIDNEKLKVKFDLKLSTRSLKKVNEIISHRAYSNVEKWFKNELTNVKDLL